MSEVNENIDVTPSEQPWPKLGDVVFQEDPAGLHNVSLDWGQDRWEIYATAYKGAADLLVERVIEIQREGEIMVHPIVSRYPGDYLAYPIIFLYRHSLELRLKELIIAGQDLLDHKPDFKLIHQLDELWATCRKILEEVWQNSPSSDLEAVESCIKEICKTDPRSMSFRYPTTTDGKPSLNGVGQVSVLNLRDVMQRVSALLEGASMGISAYRSEKPSWY